MAKTTAPQMPRINAFTFPKDDTKESWNACWDMATPAAFSGATASFGNVTEPCNIAQKFPNIKVLLRHYLQGDSILEAYWKSVAMPGQGLFVGEPLARPYAFRR